MRVFLRERLLPTTVVLAGAALVPAVAYVCLGSRMVMVPMRDHFFVVGVAGLLATAAALVLTVAGARRHEPRSVVVGVSFSAMAALLFLHAIATPGILIPMNGMLPLAGGINLPVGATILTLAAHPALRRPRNIRPLIWLQVVLLTGIVGLGALGLAAPAILPVVPAAKSAPALGLLAYGLALLALLGWRAASTFLLTRRPGDLCVAIGLVLLAGALFGLLTAGAMDAAFWIAHIFEVTGVLLVAAPAALDLRRGSAASHPLMGDLDAVQIVLAEEAFLGARVRSLMVRLAEKDGSTEEHTRRVALRAVEVGEELGLPPGRLRILAIGGLLHDMGKLAVPDGILRKPGALSDDEFAVIRRHPEWGARLLDELGGFGGDVRSLVLDHHERLDGGGYPHGRSAEQLALETRILTVCDVYDALVSDRVYRPAWPQDRALGLLHEETGTAFDGRCVAALERIVRRDVAPEYAAA